LSLSLVSDSRADGDGVELHLAERGHPDFIVILVVVILVVVQ